MVVHDGFLGLIPWKDFLPGSDVRALQNLPYAYVIFSHQTFTQRIVLDTHPYVVSFFSECTCTT